MSCAALASAGGNYSRRPSAQLWVRCRIPITNSPNGAWSGSQWIPVERWYEIIGDPTMADAILDRLVHNAYVLGVDAAHIFRSWDKPRCVAGSAKHIAEALEPCDWKRLSAGAGTKGPRLHNWCYLELADLEANEFNEDNSGLWTRGMLIRRTIADGDIAYFTTWCPAGTSIETLVKVEGHRWAIEDSFEIAKNAFGLDHNETRSWHGWHHHVSLVMLAFAMMAAIRHHANKPPLKKTKPATTRSHPISPAGQHRKSAE